MNQENLLDRLLETSQDLGAAYADLENANRQLADAKLALTQLRREIVQQQSENNSNATIDQAKKKQLLHILINVFDVNATKVEMIKIYKALSGHDLRISKQVVDNSELWHLIEARGGDKA